MGELREDLTKLFNGNSRHFICLPEKCPQGAASMCEDCAADYLSSHLELDEEKIRIIIWTTLNDVRISEEQITKLAKAIASAGVIRIKDK